MLKQTLAGLRVLLVLTVITGILYPFGIWAVSRVPGLHDNAEGSLITVNGQIVGSELIGIDPVAKDPDHDPWFHNRPSAVPDPSTSGGSNLGASNPDLVVLIQQRKELIAKREGVDQSAIPADAVTASASGLDPDISKDYALLQAPRVARENNVPLTRVRQLVDEHTAGFGVNVLTLNLAVRSAAQGAH